MEFVYSEKSGKGVSSVGQSGLSGSPDIPEPPPDDGERGLHARLRRLRRTVTGTISGLPRVFHLAWQAGPRLTVALAAATVVAGLTPAATAYTAGLLTDTIVRAIQVRAAGLPDVTALNLPLPGPAPETTTTSAVVILAGVQFLVFVVMALANVVMTITRQLLQERLTQTVQLKVMVHANGMDLGFFETARSYDLLRQAQQEAATRPVTMIASAFGLVQNAISFAGVVALLASLNPFLALAALLAPIPAFVSDSRYGMRGFVISLWASPIRRRMQYLNTLVTTDAFAKEVRLFGLGSYFVDRFRALGGVFYERQRRLVVTRYLAGGAWGLISTLTGSLIYLFIALQAASGQRTLGDLALYTAAAASLQTAVQGLFQNTSSMYENNLYLGTLYELLATPSAALPENPRPLPTPVHGHIVFEHVTFTYPGAGQPALRDVSFEVKPGQTIAVVGRNGAGKTTAVNLICRLYDPDEGRVLLDGVDIRRLDPQELRSTVAAMFQDYVTYQATAAENIGLGDVGHVEDRPRIEGAAARSGADGLITGLPSGYDTPLGKWFDQGVNLSGGEWQKVALGRAFMRDTPILLLDEPTSALDPHSEYELFENLRRRSEGRTAVYVSHRLSTVRRADRILVFKEGRISEEGTHAELMELEGDYHGLFTMQASAYVGTADQETPQTPEERR
ncbi:ABC transporter ATP-binding protein [Streptosporangium sp. NPDC001559]|uniref:ABC transporter ATP-binding protein n=1 Tax=Streptosporangium sp. NPDC001559 TaxID=3366187 RepID=UPI0036EF6F59